MLLQLFQLDWHSSLGICSVVLISCNARGGTHAGQELAFNTEKSLPEAGSSLEPTLLSRLLLCHYASLVRGLDKCPGDCNVPMLAAAQALQLHAVLRSAPAVPICCVHSQEHQLVHSPSIGSTRHPNY